MNAIDIAMKTSGTKQDFIKKMEQQGYAVRWEDSRKYITYTCPNTMSCRDVKLHDNRYLKEMMEREFEFRRIEATERRLAASRTDTPATIAERPILSSDTGKAGQPVPQSGGALGRDREAGETAKNSAAAALQHQIPTEQPTNTGTAGADQQDSIPNTADSVTGWEKEREAFFYRNSDCPGWNGQWS